MGRGGKHGRGYVELRAAAQGRPGTFARSLGSVPDSAQHSCLSLRSVLSLPKHRCNM